MSAFQPDRASRSVPLQGLGLLLRIKLCTLKNLTIQIILEAPLKILSAVVAVLLIWFGLQTLFNMILRLVREETFQGIVAVPLIMDFFFIALMLMLIFSNGIILFGSLFAREEPAYLLSKPIAPSALILLKFIESLFMSSWSLLLIGLPLMFSMAGITPFLPWYYYPLFLTFFLCFIPIPGAIALLCTWAIGRWFSNVARRILWITGATVSLGLGYWIWSIWQITPSDSRGWIEKFFERSSLIQGVYWPNAWVSRGLNHARHGELPESLFYLFIILTNALFLSWLAIRLTSRQFLLTYSRAQGSSNRNLYRSRLTQLGANILFWYLPKDLREFTLKDLRCFLRDPTQWSQLLILLGLLGLYVINIPNISFRQGDELDFQLLISFLNLSLVSLILATFTSRFVYPLVSLEGQQLWLIGALPIKRHLIMAPKLIFALTVTMLTGCGVMVFASFISQTDAYLLVINLIVTSSICLGLCGLAIGLGARLPMMHERNSARVANGVGGTINLVTSLVFVIVILALCAGLGIHFKQLGGIVIEQRALAYLAGIIMLGAVSCMTPLYIGQRYFTRLEM